jgi:hypothetical protein
MSEMTLNSNPGQPECEICRGDLESPVHFCMDAHEPFCRGCIVNYIENKVSSSYMGTCPILYCPSTVHSKAKRRKILLFENWKAAVNPEISTKYTSLANSVLAFLCGGCHTLKSLDLGYEINQSTEVYTKTEKYLQDAGTPEKYHELLNYLRAYCAGTWNLDEVYAFLHNVFPLLTTTNDEESWGIISKVLKMIPDPERRGNLHLRYLRDRPRIKTLCCNREHCFRCKIKDYHEGKSCVENTATLDHSVVTCPSCGIALARGDGCNTITCVCGKQFSWSVEKENTERSQAFLQSYPDETSIHCAIVLCTRNPSPSITQAKAWQARNRIEVSRCLTDWFKTKYWQCPSQCCAVLPSDQLPDGVKEAIELWKTSHSAKVAKCKEENEVAIMSVFTNLYPCDKDRPVAAFRFINLSKRSVLPEVDPKIIQSATKWMEKNRETYNKGLEAYEERSSRQFLFLFGNKTIRSTLPSYVHCPVATEWCRTISNADLTYTNNDTSVERVGSVSCYPAAFCKLLGEKCMFRVMVDTAPKSSNWLTFGIAKRGMANSSSDGVGRTSNSWGLSDDRSSSSNNTIVASSGTEVGTFRKLRAGDVLGAQMDVLEGWCDITVNEDEFCHRFTIASGTVDDYYFAMSFANDHRVTILPDPVGIKKTAPSKAGELNSDHTLMYNNLKKQLRLILSEDESNAATGKVPNSTLITDGSKWIDQHGDSKQFAQEAYEQMRPAVENMLNLRRDRVRAPSKDHSDLDQDPLKHLSWNTLLEAASWYRHNRDRIKEERKTELGLTFSVIHGDDAAFMAAINLMEYHTHKVEKEEHIASFAYMQMFPDEMNGWYDYNAALKEPVIENIAKGCRCLPRHNRTCPFVKK